MCVCVCGAREEEEEVVIKMLIIRLFVGSRNNTRVPSQHKNTITNLCHHARPRMVSQRRERKGIKKRISFLPYYFTWCNTLIY